MSKDHEYIPSYKRWSSMFGAEFKNVKFEFQLCSRVFCQKECIAGSNLAMGCDTPRLMKNHYFVNNRHTTHNIE